MRDQGPEAIGPSQEPASAPGVIGRATATKSARDTLFLILSDVPAERLDAFIEDYARRKLAPVVAAKIVAQGGDPKQGDAALVIARTMLEDAAKRLREGGLQRGTG